MLDVMAVVLLACTFAPLTNGQGTVTMVFSMKGLQDAVNVAKPGTIISVQNKRYKRPAIVKWPDTATNVTVRAETMGKVFLNGGIQMIIRGSFNTFSGFQFTAGKVDGVIVVVRGVANKVTHCNFRNVNAKKYLELEGSYHEAAYNNFESKPVDAPIGNVVHVEPSRTKPDYHLIRYNRFANMVGLGADFGNEPLRLANGEDEAYPGRSIVEFNLFTNVAGADSETVSVKCGENIIRYNTFLDNQEGYLVFRFGQRNVAYGNHFIRSGGIRFKEARNIWAYNNYFEDSGTDRRPTVVYDWVPGFLTNINVFHNTFVNCGTVELHPNTTDSTWENNVMGRTVSELGLFSGARGRRMKFRGNIVKGRLGSLKRNKAARRGVKVLDRGTPLLTLEAGRYRPMEGSPVVDAATDDIPAILNIGDLNDPRLRWDLAGRPRLRGKARDVGAEELDTTRNTLIGGFRALSDWDVGPEYLWGRPTPPSPPQAPWAPAEPEDMPDKPMEPPSPPPIAPLPPFPLMPPRPPPSPPPPPPHAPVKDRKKRRKRRNKEGGRGRRDEGGKEEGRGRRDKDDKGRRE